MNMVLKNKKAHHNTTHGMSNTRIYKAWAAMIARCTNANQPTYKHYGGRGISVCKRWHKFENFFEDMGDRPSKNHSIDRKNNNMGYSKANCRWATKKQQINNRNYSKIEIYKGKRICQARLSNLLGGTNSLIDARLRMGWSVEEAINTPKLITYADRRRFYKQRRTK